MTTAGPLVNAGGTGGSGSGAPMAGDVTGTTLANDVQGIHGAGGLGGTVVVGKSVQLTWDAQPVVQTLFPLRVLLADPAKGPFEIGMLVGGIGPSADDGMGWGYNMGFEAPGNELQALYNIETSFQPVPTSEQVEMYQQVARPDLSVFVRPFNAVIQRLDGQTNTNAVWVDGSSPGSWALAGGTHATPTAEIDTIDSSEIFHPDPYNFLFAGRWVINCETLSWSITQMGGSSAINAAGFLEIVSSSNGLLIGAVGAGFFTLVVGDSIQFQDHTTTSRALFVSMTDATNFRFMPQNSGTGLLGTPANQWRSIDVAGVTFAQQSISAAYTVDSGAVPDRTIWTNSTAGSFAITMPSPTKGREYFIVDAGNDLTANPVSLTAPAGVLINGSALPLSLNTSGAAYLITTEGSNYWVNKMLMA